MYFKSFSFSLPFRKTAEASLLGELIGKIEDDVS